MCAPSVTCFASAPTQEGNRDDGARDLSGRADGRRGPLRSWINRRDVRDPRPSKTFSSIPPALTHRLMKAKHLLAALALTSCLAGFVMADEPKDSSEASPADATRKKGPPPGGKK